MDNGEIVWDEEKDLTNEKGEIIRIDKTGSYSLSLLNWLGTDKAADTLAQRGIDTTDMSEKEMAYALFESSGVKWNSDAYSKTTGSSTGAYVTSGQDSNIEELENRLRFQLDDNEAFHLGKISQESPDIAYYVGDSENPINAMAQTGCYYMSTLGAVQTQAGKLLTSEQINKITETALKKGWLKADQDSIYPTGAASRTTISLLAFAELDQFGYLDFNPKSYNVDGSIIVGQTTNENRHAREGNSIMNTEIYDPYEGITYLSGQDIISDLSDFYDYVDYQQYYWQQYEEYYF